MASDLEENLIAELALALGTNLVNLRQLNLVRRVSLLLLTLLNDCNDLLFGVVFGGHGGSALLTFHGHIVVSLVLH